MTNLEIVKSTYEGRTTEENAKNLMHYLDEKVEWTEAAGFPYAGTYIGKKEIEQEVFIPMAQDWDNYRLVIDQYISANETLGKKGSVVAIGSYFGTFKKTGKSFTARVAHHWQLENGKIIRFEQFVDSVPVVEAMTD